MTCGHPLPIPQSATGNPQCRNGGFTLIEATFAVAIVAVVLAGAMQALGGATRSGLQNKEQSRAAELARDLIAEITQARYAEPNATVGFGPESGETSRALFDDVDDYNGLSESPPQSRDGAALSGFAGWQRRVEVDYVTVADPTLSSNADTGLKRIRVTLVAPTGRTSTFQSLRSQYGGYERTTVATTAYVSWVGVKVQVGPNPACRAASGANLVNLAP